MTERRMVFGDPHVCTGCVICVNVCSMHYFRVIGPSWARVRVVRLEDGTDFPLFCRNCADAPCISACPKFAIRRTSRGVVVVDNRLCDGCGKCVNACPYDAVHLQPDTQKAIKCIQCGECVKRCPVGAIWITTEKELSERDIDGRLAQLYHSHAKALYSKGGDTNQ